MIYCTPSLNSGVLTASLTLPVPRKRCPASYKITQTPLHATKVSNHYREIQFGDIRITLYFPFFILTVLRSYFTSPKLNSVDTKRCGSFGTVILGYRDPIAIYVQAANKFNELSGDILVLRFPEPPKIVFGMMFVCHKHSALQLKTRGHIFTTSKNAFMGPFWLIYLEFF